MTTSATGQSLRIIPREFVAVDKVIVRDNSTNESYTYNNINTDLSTFANYISITNQDGYVDSSDNSILKEGGFYDFTVFKTGGTAIYKDKIFVTDQTVNQANNDYYDINKDLYKYDETAGSHDNDYIIL